MCIIGYYIVSKSRKVTKYSHSHIYKETCKLFANHYINIYFNETSWVPQLGMCVYYVLYCLFGQNVPTFYFRVHTMANNNQRESSFY